MSAVTTVGVVFGGPGPEHEVSLASASGVIAALRDSGRGVVEIGVTKDGQWIVDDGAFDVLLEAADGDVLPPALRTPAVARKKPREARVQSFSPCPKEVICIDVIMPVCHGPVGEDGLLQAWAELVGKPYVGCDAIVSAACWDKWITKALLCAAGFDVTPGQLVHRTSCAEPDLFERLCQAVGSDHLFVKPARSGSSFGIGSARDPRELSDALATALDFDDAAIVERFVEHREMVVGVIDGAGRVVSPPGECRPVGALYTYAEKYLVGNALFRCPAPVEPGLADRMRRLASDVFTELRCRGMARVDLFLTQDEGLLVNEVNTVPGLSETSNFSRVMKSAGLQYRELIGALCDAAVKRPPMRLGSPIWRQYS